MVQKYFKRLLSIRLNSGPVKTPGLSDEMIKQFLAHDKDLAQAIDLAAGVREKMAGTGGHFFRLDETVLCRLLQQHILNFYPTSGINPYVPLAASGPWIVTSHGAVVHDSGGYGMLGFGHSPQPVVDVLGRPFVMANVMTPSFSQFRLTTALRQEIGRSRGHCPYEKFVFLNSGSEAVTFACRIADVHARSMTEPGGPHAGKRVMRLAMTDGFHGRTEGPARISQSCRQAYARHLASFRDPDDVLYLPVNDIRLLQRTFGEAEQNGVYFEALFLEPVMGEGVPGLAITRQFYDQARDLTQRMGTLLVVDSIQAGLRAQGCLSIVDYPGFETCQPPDLETFSKALNAGQYPLSAIALRHEVAVQYVPGLYGNTMTANPRAMEAACAVLESITDDIRDNILARGRDFAAKLQMLSGEFPGAIERVEGTGLLIGARLNSNRYKVTGDGSFEEFLRTHGIGMIHGGDSWLRFTPHFGVTGREIDLIISVIRQGLAELPYKFLAALPQEDESLGSLCSLLPALNEA